MIWWRKPGMSPQEIADLEQVKAACDREPLPVGFLGFGARGDRFRERTEKVLRGRALVELARIRIPDPKQEEGAE